MTITFEIRGFCIAKDVGICHADEKQIEEVIQRVLKEKLNVDAEILVENLHWDY